ncbi:MAG: Ig-like domain-containing protein, partial [Eubacteriales bacterium]|nr:Ig-like domain-containing protein [Eubacteriales bacterium]
MKKINKLTALLLVLCMIFCMLPITAFAADQTSSGAGIKIVQDSYSSGILIITVQAKEPAKVGVSSINVLLSFDNTKLTLMHKSAPVTITGTDSLLESKLNAIVIPQLKTIDEYSIETDYPISTENLYKKDNRTGFSVNLYTTGNPAPAQKTGDWFNVFTIRFQVSGLPDNASTVLNSDSLRIADPIKDEAVIAGAWPANDSYCVKLTTKSDPSLIYNFGKMAGNLSGDLKENDYLMAADGNNTATYDGSTNDPSSAVKLATPANPEWDTTVEGKATWTAVPNAGSYSVQLYKNGSALGSAVTPAANEYDFTADITETGSYTFKVTAIGNGTDYSNSDQSAASQPYNYTEAQIPVFTTDLSADEVVYIQNAAALSLNVLASNTDGGMLTYQWYSNITNEAIVDDAHKINGETGENYTPPTTAIGTTYYYCVVTNTLGAATAAETSEIAKITVVIDQLEKAKNDAENATYAGITQEDGMTEEALAQYVKTIAENAINNSNIIVTITDTAYVDPVAGTAQDGDGTDGSFTFTVTVSLNSDSKKTQAITVDIEATAFDGQTDEEAVEEAAKRIKETIFSVSQSIANISDQVREWLRATLLGMGYDMSPGANQTAILRSPGNGNVEITDITITSLTPAVEGDAQKPSGVNGRFTASITLKKNAETETIVINGKILALTYTPVNVPVVSVTVSPASATIERIGGSIYLSAAVTPSGATNKNVVWTISSLGGERYASVTQNGIVTARANGMLKVRATAADGSGAFGE